MKTTRKSKIVSVVAFVLMQVIMARASTLHFYVEPQLAHNQEQQDNLLTSSPFLEAHGEPSVGITRLFFMLPRDVDLKTVRLANIETAKGFASAGIPLKRIQDDGQVVDNAPLTGSYPRKTAWISGSGQMRHIKYVAVTVARQVYTAQNNHLLEDVYALAADIVYDTEDNAVLAYDPGKIPAMVTRISEKFVNAEALESLYPEYMAAEGIVNPDTLADATSILDRRFGTYEYVIITTEDVVDDSAQLGNFMSHKASMGYRVLTVTMDDIIREVKGFSAASHYAISRGQRADIIRTWLQDNYLEYGFEYLLLIGKPDPYDRDDSSDDEADVPMKMVYPKHNSTTSWNVGTDYYFADLTGDWDLDGDGYDGEHSGDTGAGGVDFCAELYVGRIPFDDYDIVDDILEKMITYETATCNATLFSRPSWRKSILMPMSWMSDTTDSSYLAEAMKDNFLDRFGYDTFTMYQHETTTGGTTSVIADSPFSSDADLVADAVVDEWKSTPYGIVCWRGHGSATKTSIGNSDVGRYGTLFKKSQASQLDDDHPSFVVQCSCQNGNPEGEHLSAELLHHGAIATVAASKNTHFSPQTKSEYCGSTTDAGIGYGVILRLTKTTCAFGKALYDTKATYSLPSSPAYYKNLLVFNLYGDPAMEWYAPDSAMVDGPVNPDITSPWVNEPASHTSYPMFVPNAVSWTFE